VRPSGERVRVEPSEDVFLVDRLDGLEARGENKRVRLARLTPGEPVYVVGTATRGFDPMLAGYRDGAVGYVVRPTRGERMLLSTDPLTERHREQSRHDTRAAGLIILGLLITHGLVFLRAWTLLVGGHVVWAPVTNAYETQSRGRSKGTVAHLTVSPEGHAPIDVATRTECYWRAKDGQLGHVPLMQAGPFEQIGDVPAISFVTALVYPTVALFGLMLVLAWRSTKRPWYLWRKLDEGAAGPLDVHKVAFK
jgi:hypothetical protein